MAKTRDYMDYLDERIEIAPANSQEEYQAAETIAEVLRDHDLETTIEEFDSHPMGQLAYPILACVLFVALLVAGLTEGAIHFIAILLAVVAVALPLVTHFMGISLFENFGPASASQNVVAVHHAAGDKVIKGARPIVIVAHYDLPRESILRRSPFARYQAQIRIATIPCQIAVAVSLLFQIMLFLPGFIRTFMWVIGLLAALPLFVLAIVDIVDHFAACTSGANDNKSSVAALLSIANKVRPKADRVDEDFEEHPSKQPRRRSSDVSKEPPVPQRVELVEDVKGVRHGADVLKSLGILPATCEVVYQEPRVQIVEQTETIDSASQVVPLREEEPAVAQPVAEDDRFAESGTTNLDEPEVDAAPADDTRRDVEAIEPEEEESTERTDYVEADDERYDEEEVDYDEEDWREPNGDTRVAAVGIWFSDRIADIKDRFSRRRGSDIDIDRGEDRRDWDADPDEYDEWIDEGEEERRLPQDTSYESVEDERDADDKTAEAEDTPSESVEKEEDVVEAEVSVEEPDATHGTDTNVEDDADVVTDEDNNDATDEQETTEVEQDAHEMVEPVGEEEEEKPSEGGLASKLPQIGPEHDDHSSDRNREEDDYEYVEVEIYEDFEYDDDEYVDEVEGDFEEEYEPVPEPQKAEVLERKQRPTVGTRIRRFFGKIRSQPGNATDDEPWLFDEEPIEYEIYEEYEPHDKPEANELPEADTSDTREQAYEEEPTPIERPSENSEEKDLAEVTPMPVAEESQYEEEVTEEPAPNEPEPVLNEPVRQEAHEEEPAVNEELEPSKVEPAEEKEEPVDTEDSKERVNVVEEDKGPDTMPRYDGEFVDVDLEFEDEVVYDKQEQSVPAEPLPDPNTLHFDREEDADIAPRDTTGLDTISDSYDLYTGEVNRVSTRVKPKPMDDPTWGVSTYQPARPAMNIARRAALFDIPDPSAATIDPFEEDGQENYDNAKNETGKDVYYESDNIQFDEPYDEPYDEPSPSKADSADAKEEEVKEETPARDNEVDDTLERPSFWGDNRSKNWKGGATVRSDIRDNDETPIVIDADDLQDAILELGDDFLVAHDIWFVATGASEAGHAGIRAFIDAHRRDIRGAFLINLDSIGAGSLSVLVREGLHAPRRADRRLVRMITGIAQDLHIPMDTASYDFDERESAASMRSRVRSVTIVGLDENNLPAYSHTADDVPENVDPGQVSNVVKLVTELIRRS